MLIHLGYVSTETSPLTMEEQVALLNKAQARNSDLGVTGVLMYREDSFFQVIEGEMETIKALFETIEKDPRHKRVEKLFEEEISEREFPEWSMTFREIDDELLRLMPEFAESQPEELKPNTLFRDLPRVRQLLYAFQSMS